MALVAVVVSLVGGNYEHVDAVRRALRIVLCMPGRTDGHFSLGLSNGERLRQLLNSNRETEREGDRGQCHAHFASEKEEEEAKAVNAMGYASFFTAIAGQGGARRGNWAWSARFAPADCKISDLRSCGLRDKMQSVVDPVHCTPLPLSLPRSIAILCLYNLSIHQAHNKAIKATLDDANPIKANSKQLQLLSKLNPKPISISICNLETPHRSRTSTRLKLKLKLNANLSSSAKFLRIANGSSDDDDDA